MKSACFGVFKSLLCALALVFAAGAAHAQAWLNTYNYDYIGTWAANHNLSRAVGHCVRGLGGCAGGRRSGPQASQRMRALPRRGGAGDLLYTGRDFATTRGIEQLVSTYPREKQVPIAQEYTTLIITFNNTIPRIYGIPKNNLATAYAALLVGSYTAYTNRPFPDDAVRPLYRQLEQVILDAPEIYQASASEKNALYQIWVGLGMVMMASQVDLAERPNQARQARLRQAGANALRALLGVEPDRVRFTARGMEFL